MVLQSHFIATTITAMLMKLEGRDLILAYTFGNLLDLDHLLFPSFIKSVVKGKINEAAKDDSGKHTIIHEPIFLIVTLVFSILLKTPVPSIFWLIHILLDHIVIKAMKRPFSPFNNHKYRYGIFPQATKSEWIWSSILIVPVLAYLYFYIFRS